MATSIDRTKVQQMLAEGLSQREIARRLNVPRTTLQGVIHELQRQASPPIQAQVIELGV